jgi:DNA-binding MarR family transcriptional regulator
MKATKISPSQLAVLTKMNEGYTLIRTYRWELYIRLQKRKEFGLMDAITVNKRTLEYLRKMELIERVENDQDRYSTYYKLSETGKKAITQ